MALSVKELFGKTHFFCDRLESIFAFRHQNAFSYHGSFYTWAPTDKMPETVIAFSYNDAGDDFFNPFFEEVTPVRKIYSDFASGEGWVVQTIFICHKPKQSFDKMKELFKKRIFE